MTTSDAGPADVSAGPRVGSEDLPATEKCAAEPGGTCSCTPSKRSTHIECCVVLNPHLSARQVLVATK